MAFQEASVTVREDVGNVSLQLLSIGAYNCNFTVSVMCSAPQVGNIGECVPAEHLHA